MHFCSGHLGQIGCSTKDSSPAISVVHAVFEKAKPKKDGIPSFGGPFLVWHPMKYAGLLAEKMKKHKSNVWLVNTGWSGGAYGVGKHLKLALTRAIMDSILGGRLASAKTASDPVFGFEVVTECVGVPAEVLVPRQAWADKPAFEATAKRLAGLFKDNFKKYEDKVDAAVKDAGPKR